MRKSTAIVATLVAASSLAISLRLGDIATQENLAPDISASEPTKVDPTTPSPSPTQSGQPNPAPSPSGTTAPAIPKPKPVTKNSDVIDYKYGVVQVSVTMLGNEITKVGLLQGDATNGRDKAYAILTEATIQVQGTNYGNVSGATYTTEAFKLAVESALEKF